jgi:anti-sigma B factor antagonist
VIVLPGEIDICSRGQVETGLSLALRDGATVLIADAAHTTFCDCSGVHALIRAHRQAAAANVQLRIAASPAMRRILQLTGADHVLEIHSTVPEALAGR